MPHTTDEMHPFEQERHAYQEQMHQLNTLIDTLREQINDLTQQNTLLEDELALTEYAQNISNYKTYFDALPIGIVVINGFGTILDLNDAAATYLSHSSQSCINSSLRGLLSKSSFADFTYQFNQFKQDHPESSIFYGLQLQNKKQFTLRLSSILSIGNGNRNIIVGVILPLTDSAQHSNYLANIMIDQLREGITVTDARGIILRVNNAFSEISGFSPDDAIGKTPNLLKSGRHPRSFYRQMWTEIKHHGWWAGEVWNRRKNGQIYPQWLQISRVNDPLSGKIYYVSTFTDITERKQHQHKLDRLAHYDTLTGLINRHFLKITLEGLLERTGKGGRQKLAVLFIDLDHFKQINDRFGHHQGDIVLQEAAQRILASVRNTDIVSRIGGDEFVVVLQRIQDIGDVDDIAQKLLRQIHQPFTVDNHQHHISASIGVTLYPEHGHNVEDLMKRADSAMYRAKQDGRNGIAIFDVKDEQQLISYDEIKQLLRLAIDNPSRHIEMHYQPIVDSRSGIPVSYEALIRLRTPNGDLLTPVSFIEIAEAEGLIIPLGEALFQEICQFIAMQHPSKTDIPPIAVNLSALQFNHDNLFEKFLAIAQHFGIPLERFKFEITETSTMQNLDRMLSTLQAFQQAGCEILLDDFGTGYASLSQLHMLPVNTIKIDRSFIQLIDTQDDYTHNLIRAILSIAETLELKVITEGVETETQSQWLQDHRVIYMQGYFYSKPISQKQLQKRWLS